MILRFLGQSGYELSSGNSRILIDPYFSDIVGKLQGRPRMHPVPLTIEEMPCDCVICTHNHLDHLDPETVVLFPENQSFITTVEGCPVIEKLGRPHVTSLQEGDTVTVGDFTITAVFAMHSTEAFGLIVEAEGIRLYFSGDTLFSEQLFEIQKYRPDVTLICINGRLGNMNTEEAITVAKAIGAKVNIPNHYDMFASNSADPYLFADHIPGGKVLDFNRPYEIAALL